MMKWHSFVSFLLLCNALFSQIQLRENKRYPFPHNDTLYTYNATALLNEPLAKSKRVAQLTMGELIFADTSLSINDSLKTVETTKYLSVRWKNKVGYIPISDVAVKRFQLDNLGALLLIQSQNTESDSSNYFHLKALTLVRTTSELLIKQHGNSFFFGATNNRGLNGVLSLGYIDHYPTQDTLHEGRTYFAWNGEQISLIGTLLSHHSQHSKIKEHFIFPTDEDGKENTLIFKRDELHILDLNHPWQKSSSEYREYQWENNLLNPTFPEPQ